MSKTARGETESVLQDQIRLTLGARPDLVVVFRNNIGNAEMRGRRVQFGVGGPGGADLLGLTRTGRFVAIEIKRPTGKLTPEQQTFRDLVLRLGGVHLVMRSVEDASAWLSELETP